MTKESFEIQLRDYLHREPFEPITIELEGGRRITVDRPSVAINNGGAGFLSDQEGLVDIRCNDVRSIKVLASEDVGR